jgi:Flp pilus assembly protein TadG
MDRKLKTIDLVKGFFNDCRGAILVEFAIVMPMLLLVFSMMIEGSRLMWSYQSTISGVRDATRYLARVAPLDICSSGGSVAAFAGDLTAIVANNINGASIFPASITVNSVSPSLSCIAGTYRVNPAPVVQVSANITITFAFSGLFTLAGSNLANVSTTVTDQSRVFGT